MTSIETENTSNKIKQYSKTLRLEYIKQNIKTVSLSVTLPVTLRLRIHQTKYQDSITISNLACNLETENTSNIR